MTRALHADTHRIALDLHALLRDTDPSRFCDDLEARARARLDDLHHRVRSLLDARPPDSATVWSRMAELATLLEQHAPALSTYEDRVEAWTRLHDALRPVYARLTAALSDATLPLYDALTPTGAPPRATALHPAAPSRPTNYARNVVHAACGIGVILLVELVLTTAALRIGVAAAGVVWAWSMELGRRHDPRINAVLMKILGPIAHPHETHSINSATWYTTSLLFLALGFDLMAGAVALAVLALGDPMAAIIGRRFGRIRLVNGRSLEGTMAFILTGLLGALGVLTLWHPEYPAPVALGIAATAAGFGAMAELFTRRIDDNLSIPLAAAIGATLAAWVLT